MSSIIWWMAGAAALVLVGWGVVRRLAGKAKADTSIYGVNFAKHKGKEQEKR